MFGKIVYLLIGSTCIAFGIYWLKYFSKGYGIVYSSRFPMDSYRNAIAFKQKANKYQKFNLLVGIACWLIAGVVFLAASLIV